MMGGLSIAEIREGLAGLNIRLDERDDQTACPVCGVLPPTLTVRQNGDGAHVECANGCAEQAVIGAITVGRRLVDRTVGHDHLQLVRDRLGLPELERIVKRGRLGDSYELRLVDGRVIDIGNAAILQSQPRFRARYMPQIRDLPPRIKGADEWDAFVVAVEKAAEELDDVATPAEETHGWLAGWLRQARYVTIEAGDSTALYDLLGSPPPAFVVDGRLHVHLPDLSAWVNRFAGTRITAPELSARLATLEFTRSQPAARQGNDVRKARYWASPQDFEVDG